MLCGGGGGAALEEYISVERDLGLDPNWKVCVDMGLRNLGRVAN